MKKKILIVDDDPDIVLMLTDRLESQGYQTLSATDGKKALDAIELESPHLVLLDLALPYMSGQDVLDKLAESAAAQAVPANSAADSGEKGLDLPVVVMTANATIPAAVAAMKTGAYDFLTKPIDFDHLCIVVRKALERFALRRQVSSLRTEVESRYQDIVGTSPSIKSVVELANRAASCDATVLLLGDSGTGKELFARSIHQWSGRKHAPFQVVSCVNLGPELLENELFGHEKEAYTHATSRRKGKIEEADGGTIFLDEIGDMPLALQPKILRLLETHAFQRIGGARMVKVDIRVIAATNKDLRQAVNDGTFREDLFFRLNVVSLALPPLRERPDDIVPLAEFFLERHLREMKRAPKTFSAETIEAMKRYDWPGNIREISNAIARAVALGADEEISPEQLGLGPWGVDPFPVGENLPYHDAIERYSCHIIEQALRRCDGNQTKASDLLQLQRTYLHKLMKRKNIRYEPGRKS